MAKAKRKKSKGNPFVERFVRPTPEREAANDFEGAGAAYRVVPVIDTMLKAKRPEHRLTQAQYDALKHYRDTAHRAEDDVAQSSPLDAERIMGGVSSSPSGGAIPVVLLSTPAIRECREIEANLGSLLALARAVAVNDWTLTRWAIETSGGREQQRDGRVDIVPRNPKAVDMARMELRFAAARIRPNLVVVEGRA